MRAPLTLLLGAFTCALAAPAFAAPPGPNTPPVHVLEIYTDDADDQAKALTIALKSKVRTSKDYSLGESDKALGVYLAQFKCGDVPDSVCQTKIGDNLKADRYIWGTVRKDGADLAVDIHLWQKGQNEVRQQIKISANLTDANDPSLQQVAEQIVSKLVNFGKVGIAHLAAAQSIDGELFVDNTSMGRFTNGQAELTLPIGEHRFEVRAQGKLVAQGTGKVSPTATVDIELAAIAKTEQPPPPPSEGGSWKRPAGYAAVGVGGALIIGGVVSMLKVNSLNKDSGFDAYRHSFAGDKDVCDVAKKGRVGMPGASSPGEVVDLCSSASTYKTLQFVLLPVGALAAAAGVYLITSSGGEGEAAAPSTAASRLRRLQIAPSIGKSSGSLDIRYEF